MGDWLLAFLIALVWGAMGWLGVLWIAGRRDWWVTEAFETNEYARKLVGHIDFIDVVHKCAGDKCQVCQAVEGVRVDSKTFQQRAKERERHAG